MIDKEKNKYELVGKIDKERSIDSDLSESFVNLFKDGFFTEKYASTVTKEKMRMLREIQMKEIVKKKPKNYKFFFWRQIFLHIFFDLTN